MSFGNCLEYSAKGSREGSFELSGGVMSESLVRGLYSEDPTQALDVFRK